MAANQNFQGQPCSAIEAVWPQNETITQGILQYLNLRDVWNMRKTNSTMNVLLQGHSRPLNPNTTLSFVGASCDEGRPRSLLDPTLERCTNGPRRDVLMKYCEVTSAHGNRNGGPFNVCEDCQNHNNLACGWFEHITAMTLRVPVCETCEAEIQNAFPRGGNTCVCEANMRGEWKCHRCRTRAQNRIELVGLDRLKKLRVLYRNQDGKVYYGPRRPTVDLGCRCGRTLSGAQRVRKVVLWCAGCEGVIVARSAPQQSNNPPQPPSNPAKEPSNPAREPSNPAKEPSNVAKQPINPAKQPYKLGEVILRRSARIAKRKAAEELAEQAKPAKPAKKSKK